MWSKTSALLFLIISLLASSCSSKGEFAYKTYDMDTYRNMGDSFEFPSDKPFDWVYRFGSSPGKKRMTIIIQKKELVWADIYKEAQNTEKESPFIHGQFDSLEPGDYRIVIVNENKIAAEKEFTVYNSEYPVKTEED